MAAELSGYPLSKAAWSLFVYGLYIGFAGLVMIVYPRPFLFLLELPDAAAPAMRFAGVLCVALAAYDILSARTELVPFFRWSFFTRTFAFCVFALLFALGEIPVMLMVVGVVDFAAAWWTWRTLPRASAQIGPIG